MTYNIEVRFFYQPLCSFLLAASFGCHAQLPATAGAASSSAGEGLSPDLARRVEVLIRKRTSMPPNVILRIGARSHSDIPEYDQILITFTQDGKTSSPAFFLISKDGKTVAQFSKFDIGQDPKTVVSGAGRPARGGPESAPVEIVGFDDLECPYCTKMHAELFPALTERYGDKVRIVYRDFPLSIHPWAMRAAVDVNCVGAQNGKAYWEMVDSIHAHATDYGGAEKSLEKANASLDQLAVDEARKDHLKVDAVEACVKKQDESAIRASLKVGEDLGIEATPVLFINGEKFEGAYPIEDVFRMVDGAMVAAGQTPPPPYVAPVAASAAPAPSGK